MTGSALAFGLSVVIFLAVVEELAAMRKNRKTETLEVILAGLLGLLLVSGIIEAAD
jgi:multisubunit Na+/H+ antiporter MnhB subunit